MAGKMTRAFVREIIVVRPATRFPKYTAQESSLASGKFSPVTTWTFPVTREEENGNDLPTRM